MSEVKTYTTKKQNGWFNNKILNSSEMTVFLLFPYKCFQFLSLQVGDLSSVSVFNFHFRFHVWIIELSTKTRVEQHKSMRDVRGNVIKTVLMQDKLPILIRIGRMSRPK